MTAPIVSLRNVSRSFDVPGPWPWSPSVRVDAVVDVDLELRPGDVLALVGQSGSGKTTVSRLVLGLERPSRGEVYLEGSRWDDRPERERRPFRRRYQYVPQDAMSALDPQQTVLEHVVESLRVLVGRSREAAVSEAATLLARLGLSARHDALPRELSGGEQRRVTLARVLALSPVLIVADEPTSGLDADRQDQVLEDLVRNMPAGAAMILVTHDMPQVRKYCTRVAVMLGGRIIEEMADASSEPSHPYARMLFDPWGDHDTSLSVAS